MPRTGPGTVSELPALLAEAHACAVCASALPLGPRPILQLGGGARLLIASQAPGRLAHQAGRPFADPSGATLRAWLGLPATVFHDPGQVAILPTALCYPGRGPGGDRRPPAICAQLWRARLMAALPAVRLTLLVGGHALRAHRPAERRPLTAAVRAWRDFLPAAFPLPHPSPRNRPWLRRHPWFAAEVLPALRAEVRRALGLA